MLRCYVKCKIGIFTLVYQQQQPPLLQLQRDADRAADDRVDRLFQFSPQLRGHQLGGLLRQRVDAFLDELLEQPTVAPDLNPQDLDLTVVYDHVGDVPREDEANDVGVEAKDEVVPFAGRVFLERGVGGCHVDPHAVLARRPHVHVDRLAAQVRAVSEDFLPDLHFNVRVDVEVGLCLR